VPSPTVREVTRWITSHASHLSDDEAAKLGRVKARSTQLNATATHVTAFAEMMTSLHGERLPAWVAAVERDDLPSLHSFTRGIRHDQPAVVNGLTLAHSSGAVEGKRLPGQSPQAPDVRPRQPRPAAKKGSCSADNSTQSHRLTIFVLEPFFRDR
jgi:hypothetical protein